LGGNGVHRSVQIDPPVAKGHARMFPKKEQVWTNRERGRSLGLTYGIAAVLCLVIGVYLGVAQSNWLVLIVAVVTAAAGLYVYANERDHRGEP
jgi:hypothetical protein